MKMRLAPLAAVLLAAGCATAPTGVGSDPFAAADVPVASSAPVAPASYAAAAALVSLDPSLGRERRLAGLWRGLALLVPLVLAAGWLIDAAAAGPAALIARLDWREGLDCWRHVLMLALPLLTAMALLMRHGAPVDPRRTAAAAGLASAGAAAFIFAFACDHDDPLYVVVWYGLAVIGLTLLARLVLPRLARW